jgi:hypothetical protein
LSEVNNGPPAGRHQDAFGVRQACAEVLGRPEAIVRSIEASAISRPPGARIQFDRFLIAT